MYRFDGYYTHQPIFVTLRNLNSVSQLSEDIATRLVVDGMTYRESFGSYASIYRNSNMNNGMLERDLVLSLEVNTESVVEV